ncbi:polysaccharide pyruvyl transferase family protein [Pseudomonas fragi]|uniref:Polysaccharide pyruvyl transferase family protein n=1 Tax=Pseudomonas fragi TaxID=296 RepID=A0A9Q6VIH2_PSEFR|nr:polysaccharide pyruvyl transferase family protein [Pseudomonas fragi]QPL29987.1 polysaccharide pyruvyl transferase family protein [Pseudomonas fragi]
MKIGIITIHNSCNYGAVLQAFATQESFKKYGDVEILNYRNTHTDKPTKLLRFGTKPKDALRLAKDILKLLPKTRILKKFRFFFAEHYNLSGQPSQNLEVVEKKYDIYVCGSDQIWNPQIISEDGKIDKNYFLAFSGTGKKISYASSMGSYSYTSTESLEIKTYLQDFHRISVRESDTAQFLSTTLQREVDHVLDPTLLLNKKEWTSVLNIKDDSPKKSYMLVYVLRNSKILSETVKAVAEALDLDIIVIDQDPFTTLRCTTHINDAGPIDFVKLFSNASFVITNSFHGCAFSVNFNIPFLITPPPSGLNRIMSLLSAVGAETRAINTRNQAIETAQKEVDFDKINLQLDILRSKSKKFISDSIESIELT